MLCWSAHSCTRSRKFLLACSAAIPPAPVGSLNRIYIVTVYSSVKALPSLFVTVINNTSCKYSFKRLYMSNDVFDTSKLTDDQVLDLVYSTLETLCEELENRGIEPDYIDSTLFILFTERMYVAGDREAYEGIIEDALNDSWPGAPTIH